LNPARFLGESNDERAGFKNIDVQFTPITDAAPELIEEWISIIKKGSCTGFAPVTRILSR